MHKLHITLDEAVAKVRTLARAARNGSQQWLMYAKLCADLKMLDSNLLKLDCPQNFNFCLIKKVWFWIINNFFIIEVRLIYYSYITLIHRGSLHRYIEFVYLHFHDQEQGFIMSRSFPHPHLFLKISIFMLSFSYPQPKDGKNEKLKNTTISSIYKSILLE